MRLPRLSFPRTLLAAAAFAAATLATPSAAVGQCSPVGSTEHAIADSFVVFVGLASDVSEDGRIVQMEVLSVWKGPDLGRFVEVRGAPSADAPATATDRHFKEGARYLVIPENRREPFLASACSATQPFTGKANLIPQSYQEGAGATSGRVPEVVAEGATEADLVRSVLPLLGTIALIALGWVAIVWSRGAEPERLEDPDPEEKVSPPKLEHRRLKRRSVRRDSRRKSTVALRTVKQNRRRWRARRRRKDLETVETLPSPGAGD